MVETKIKFGGGTQSKQTKPQTKQKTKTKPTTTTHTTSTTHSTTRPKSQATKRTWNQSFTKPNLVNPITTFRNGVTEVKQLYWNRPRIVLCPLLLLIFCLQIVTTVTPHWLQLHDVHYQGIWRVCTQTKFGIKCFRYDVQPEYFKPIQAMMVVASVLYMVSLSYVVYMLKIKKAPAFVLTATIALAGTLSIGSLGWFTDANLQTVTLSAMKFGWSYYVGWVTVFLTLCSAVISLWDERYRAAVVT